MHFWILVGKMEETNRFEALSADGRIILKPILKIG